MVAYKADVAKYGAGARSPTTGSSPRATTSGASSSTCCTRAAEMEGGLTRANIMNAAWSIDFELPLILGGTAKVDGITDAYTSEYAEMLQYDATNRFAGAHRRHLRRRGQDRRVQGRLTLTSKRGRPPSWGRPFRVRAGAWLDSARWHWWRRGWPRSGPTRSPCATTEALSWAEVNDALNRVANGLGGLDLGRRTAGGGLRRERGRDGAGPPRRPAGRRVDRAGELPPQRRGARLHPGRLGRARPLRRAPRRWRPGCRARGGRAVVIGWRCPPRPASPPGSTWLADGRHRAAHRPRPPPN